MNRNLYLLVHEASGLVLPRNVKSVSACVKLAVGSFQVSKCKIRSVPTKILLMCVFQATTKVQSCSTPFWNEILQVSVPSLPSCGTLRLEVTYAGEQFLANIDFGTTFGFILTENLHHGFCDEWLVSSKNCTTPEDQADIEMCPNNQLKLHISCSFDPDLVLARQRGLWPSCTVDPPRDPDSRDIRVSRLMPKSSLVYRQRLQQIPAPSNRREAARPTPCSAIRGGRNSPAVDPDPADPGGPGPHCTTPRRGSPERARQRPQRRYSEVVGSAGRYAFTYEHERPYARDSGRERPSSAQSFPAEPPALPGREPICF